MTSLDAMIRQLELDLGQAHSKSPFDLLRQKYGSSGAKPSAPKKEEPKTAEAPKKEEVKQEKKPKGAKQPKGGAPAGPKVDLPEELALFNSCDLRVGRIVECEIRPDSEKLYFEKIDLGEGTLREIGSGL